MTPLQVLIVDDEPQIRRILARLVLRLECQAHKFSTGEEALAWLSGRTADLMLLDLRMPGKGGMAVLQEVRGRWPDLPVVIITAYGSLESGIEAMKAGAIDYIQKPFDSEQIRLVVERTRERRRLLAENHRLASAQQDQDQLREIVGEHPSMRELKCLIEQIAPVSSTVLITGETGTGKELVARMIHRLSLRRPRPFVVVNCAAIPKSLMESYCFGHVRGAFTGAVSERKGYFEEADSGTVFLDEIGELDLELQSKILRVLQEGEFVRVGEARPIRVDVRVIAATHRQLKQEVDAKRFREDLYYRLSVLPLHLPPLRERIQDLPLLVANLLPRLCLKTRREVKEIDPEYLDTLSQYTFPGNVRELENILERSLVLSPSPRLSPAFLPAEVRTDTTMARVPLNGNLSLRQAKARATEAVESKLIAKTLEERQGNFTLAARQLKISRSALYYKVKRYGIPLRYPRS
jgi:two-component system NtrC family response regulator